jgi:hypothetical protein
MRSPGNLGTLQIMVIARAVVSRELPTECSSMCL